MRGAPAARRAGLAQPPRHRQPSSLLAGGVWDRFSGNAAWRWAAQPEGLARAAGSCCSCPAGSAPDPAESSLARARSGWGGDCRVLAQRREVPEGSFPHSQSTYTRSSVDPEPSNSSASFTRCTGGLVPQRRVPLLQIQVPAAEAGSGSCPEPAEDQLSPCLKVTLLG